MREKRAVGLLGSAVQIYLKAKERLEIETRLVQAYSGEADNLLDEVEALLGAQTLPNDFRFEGRRPA